MQFAVVLPSFGPPARDPAVQSRLREVAVAADELGYHVVFAAEHLIYPQEIRTPYPYGGHFPYAVTDPVLDVPTTLAWVAGMTRHVRLGASVMVLPYHEPIALAKALTTIDVLSGGRLMVGVASGWLREEFDLLGVPFRERGARTDEYLAALRALWTEDRVTFRGRFVRLEDAAFFPKPIQKPHPPIWIGGASAAAFRRVGRVGDGWLAVPRAPAELARDVAAIRREAEAAGRDPSRIGVAASGGARSVAELLDRIPALERAGATIVTVPALFWAASVPQAIDLMDEFASRADLERRE
jgi:probable F420-dependent oxidoreductase